MWWASSLARKRAAAARSSGGGMRPGRRRGGELLAPARLPVGPAQDRIGLHEPRREGVHPHVRREGLGVGLRDPQDAVLARGVLRRAGAAAHDHGRADVHDGAALLLEHALPELVGHQHRPLDVDGKHVVDRLLRQLAPRRLLRRHVADVVDQRVERAELVEHPGCHAPDVVPRGDVPLHEERLRACVAHPRCRLLGPRGGAAVVHDDGSRPLGRRAGRDLRAEAGAGSRHHHRLALEPPLAHQAVLLVACGLEPSF